MNKNKWITLILILSLVSNVLLVIVVFNIKTNKESQEELLKNAIILNEFSERAKEWRNFNVFIEELTKQEENQFPVSERQSDIYWELATPMKSVISKATDDVLENEYSAFLFYFDDIYEDVIDEFKEKLPLMNREQLNSLANKLNDIYKTLVGKGKWSITHPDTKIDVDFKKENLEIVIEQLISIHNELQGIK